MTLHRLLRRITMLSLLPIVIGAGIALYLSNRNIEAVETRLLDVQTDVAEARLQDAMLFARTILASVTPVAGRDAGCDERLARVHAEVDDAISSLTILAEDAGILCASPVAGSSQFGGPESLLRPAAGPADEDLRITGYQVDRATGTPSLFVSRTIVLPDSGARAIAVAAIRLDWLSRHIKSGRVNSQADVVVTGPDSSVIVSTFAPVDVGPRPTSPEEAGTRPPRPWETDLPTRLRTANVAGVDFRILAVANPFGSIQQVTSVAAAMVAILLTIGITTTLLSYRWLRQSVLEPLEKLRAAAPELSQGLAVRIDPGKKATAELVRISQEFTDMSDKIARRTAALEQACDESLLAYWTIEPGSDQLHVAPENRGLMGFDTDKVALSDIRDRVEPDDRPALDAALHRVITTGERTVLEYRGTNRNGEKRFFRSIASMSQAGTAAGSATIFGITQDVTEFREKEVQLERSLALLRVAGRTARLGGWRYDMASEVLVNSAEMMSLWPVKIEETSTPQDVLAQIDKDDREVLSRSFWTCVGNGTPFDEVVKVPRNGSVDWMRVIGEPEYDASGRIIAVRGAMQDITDVIHAQRERNDLETLLRIILDSLGDGFVVRDPEGLIRYMNPRAQTILGISGPDMSLGRELTSNLPPEVCDALSRMTAQTQEHQRSATEDVQIQATNRCVEITAHPTQLGVAFHFRDVTAEREMRTRMRLLDVAIPRLNDAIVITEAAPIESPGPKVVFINDAFERQTGYSRDEVLGRSIDMLLGKDTEPDRLIAMRDSLGRLEPLRTEVTFYRKDGTPYSVDVDANVLTDDEGRPTHFVGVHRETTERRRTEERIRASEERFRLVSLASKDIIWDWDITTGRIWHSDNIRQLFGITGDTVLPFEAILERIHPDDRLDFTRSLDQAMHGDKSNWHCDYRAHDAKGAIRHITNRGSILRTDDGLPRRMVGAMTDVTEMRELDAQLHMASKMQSIGQLTGGIAHDFNNLLTIVLGNCDMILDSTDDENLKKMLGSVILAAERGAEMAGGLLAYARRQKLETRPTDINHLILTSAKLFSSAVDATIDIDYHLSSEDVVARADPDKLQSALLNLVLNSQSAMVDGGQITITTRRITVGPESPDYSCPPGNYVQISVADTGCGMTPDVAEKAFEPFFTTREMGVGTGLGLSSVYGLVTQSEGHIELDTAPGAGTTITLCLPTAEERPISWPETRASSMPRFAGADVLVVEDDGGVRAFVREALERMGHVVTTAENGAAALALFEEGRRFNLMCTDIVMPGEPNGHKLASLALALQPDLKVLLMTGYADRVLEEPAATHHSILFKPFRSIDLAGKVQQLLSEPQQRRPE